MAKLKDSHLVKQKQTDFATGMMMDFQKDWRLEK